MSEHEPPNEPWRLIRHEEDIAAWKDYGGQAIITIARARPGFDHYNIYDTTNTVVEGGSLGPFKSIEHAIERVQEDYPSITLE